MRRTDISSAIRIPVCCPSVGSAWRGGSRDHWCRRHGSPTQSYHRSAWGSGGPRRGRRGDDYRQARRPDAVHLIAGWAEAWRGQRSCCPIRQPAACLAAVRPVALVSVSGYGDPAVSAPPCNAETAKDGPRAQIAEAATEWPARRPRALGMRLKASRAACDGRAGRGFVEADPTLRGGKVDAESSLFQTLIRQPIKNRRTGRR